MIVLLGAQAWGGEIPFPGQGLRVATVAEASAGERAGLGSGDVLTGWERLPAGPGEVSEQGVLRTPFDWVTLTLEQTPRGTVRLLGFRGGFPLAADLPPGRPGVRLAPIVKDPADPLHRAWQSLEEANRCMVEREWSEALVACDAAVQQAREAREPAAEAVAWDETARAREGSNDLAGAAEALDMALSLRGPLGIRTLPAALSLHRIGTLAERRGDPRSARAPLDLALEIWESLAPRSLEAADTLNSLGHVHLDRWELDAAESRYRQALALRSELAPGSTDVAGSFNNLGLVAARRGNWDDAEILHGRALAIWERIAPDSLNVAMSLHNLGNIADQRGNFEQAEDRFRKALAIRLKLAPGSPVTSQTWTSLAGQLRGRSAFAESEQAYQEALRIQEAILPGSMSLAITWFNLGMLHFGQLNLDQAELYFRKVLTVTDRQAPHGRVAGLTLMKLGELARWRKDLDSAAEFLDQAAAILRKNPTDQSLEASWLNHSAKLARDRGEFEEAERLSKRLLVMREVLSPGGDDAMSALFNLGETALDRKDPNQADVWFRRVLGIVRTKLPGSRDEAYALRGLGEAALMSGRTGEAIAFFYEAVDIFERTANRLGSLAETRNAFRAWARPAYLSLVEALVAVGRPEEAFDVLERSRAQGMLAMMAQRELGFSADIPPDLEQERRRLDREYDQAQRRVWGLDADRDGPKREAALARLRELREAQDRLAERIRQVSPRLEALRRPRPLTCGEVRRSLDPGTVLLSYAAEKTGGYLFALSREGGLKVSPVPLGVRDLRAEVESFRELVEASGFGGAGPELTRRARRLYDRLVRPAQALVSRARRLVILPDGPLHLLPFAALVCDDGAPGGRARYLCEWKPLHTALSATVYQELRSRRKGGGPGVGRRLSAFGDPVYVRPAGIPGTGTPDGKPDTHLSTGPVPGSMPGTPPPPAAVSGGPSSPEVSAAPSLVPVDDSPPARGGEAPAARPLRIGGTTVTPLPATRLEAEGIVRAWGPSATAFLGEEATEERAMEQARGSDVLHFACHGILDERIPLDSGLMLTVPPGDAAGRENGFLQAWEVFERMRCAPDLVVLSACATALGKESGGEGLVGLTRAFEYAGARSVLSTLWRIDDRSTARWMERFYAHLKAGLSKDEALRRAQVDFIRGVAPSSAAEGGAASAPFFWAAFQLDGDWR